MAALTGTQIVALARLYAQDDGTNKGVTDAEALLILNDVILAFRDEQYVANEKFISATTSGLTFAAGDTVKTTTSTDLQSINTVHQSATAALPSTGLHTPELREVSVLEILDMHADDGDGVVAQTASEWECYAQEKIDGGPPGQIRVYVYPALRVTRYLHIKAFTFQTLGTLLDTPDLTERESRDAARILALIMCPLLHRSPDFVSGVLRWIKPELLERVGGAATYMRTMPDRVAERVA